MNTAERQQWILDWVRENLDKHKYVNILCTEFVDAYIQATDAKFKLPMFGAPKCPQLGRDLGKMYADRRLQRSTCGLPTGDASMGFPKWVYEYSL